MVKSGLLWESRSTEFLDVRGRVFWVYQKYGGDGAVKRVKERGEKEGL